jgi:RimJ/RimL family protein N-acetyltransferase
MDSLITPRLILVPQSREAALAQVEAMTPSDRAQVSPVWLERVQSSAPVDPWNLGFQILRQVSQMPVGSCGFTGPPDSKGTVEIAYCILPEEQGRGYATEAATAMVEFALGDDRVRIVCAHTLTGNSASGRVLTKCGFHCVGEVEHPEDGRLLRWEKYRGHGCEAA